MRRRDFIAGGATALTNLLSPLAGRAQSGYPTKQIHLVVPTSAGGVHDVIGRIWADRVKSALGTIIIENRAGGGSSIGLNYVAQQPADGHLLLVGSTSTLVLREGGNNRAYDALKDIRSATIVATTSTSIAVHPSLPIHSVKELIAYAKANPGKLSYGSGGVGAPHHLYAELFKSMTGIQLTHVPYKGSVPALTDVLSGQIPLMIVDLTPALQLIQEGKIRAFGCSNFDARQLAEAQDSARINGLPAYQVLQPEYNLADRASYEGPLRDLAMQQGLGVITYYSLASGFLTGKYRTEADLGQSVRGGGVRKYLNPRGLRILGALDQVAQRHGTQPAVVALAWLIGRPGVTAPIASATSVEQLRTFSAAAELALSDSDRQQLEQASAPEAA